MVKVVQTSAQSSNYSDPLSRQVQQLLAALQFGTNYGTFLQEQASQSPSAAESLSIASLLYI